MRVLHIGGGYYGQPVKETKEECGDLCHIMYCVRTGIGHLAGDVDAHRVHCHRLGTDPGCPDAE